MKQPEHDIRGLIVSRVAAHSGTDASTIDTASSFAALGLDSVASVGMTSDLESHLGHRIPAALIADYDTIDDLTAYLTNHLQTLSRIESHPSNGNGDGQPDPAAWFAPMTERFNRWKQSGTFFYEPVVEALDGAWAVVDGRRMLMMASYSYLGLIGHPRIAAATRAAVERFGAGSHGARLLGGTTTLHRELEERIARFKGAEAAVAYTTGYMTNLATISTLTSPGDWVIGDALNHASIVDGCKFSGAEFVTFPHNDLAALAAQLQRAGSARKLVVIDAVYSMDGDIAPLPEIVRLCREHGALLMADEAHSVGVLGATGRGIAEHFGLPADSIDVQMGTLSKTIPSVGGYIAGKRELIDALKYNARGYIFSVALPPPQAAAASAAIEVMTDEPQHVRKLRHNTQRYVEGLRREGFAVHDFGTPIVPLPCPSEDAAFAMTRGCWEAGLLLYPIVYPAVPTNQPRVRTFMTAAHSDADIDFAVKVLGRLRCL